MNSKYDNINNNGNNKDHQEKTKDSKDNTKDIDIATKKESGLSFAHDRLRHRLITARATVWGGGICIFLLTILGFACSPKEPNVAYELLRTAITTLATITTLGLGFIAGSNIESSK